MITPDTSVLAQFFVEHYNKKKPDNALDGAQFHLEKKAGVALYGDDLLHHAVEKYDDIFLKSGTNKAASSLVDLLTVISRCGYVVEQALRP